MKRISEPPFPIEGCTICQNLSLEEYRKNFPFFQGICGLLPNLAFHLQKVRMRPFVGLKIMR
jgi:hypothetical protein